MVFVGFGVPPPVRITNVLKPKQTLKNHLT